jgi:hypothetical protein
VSIPEFYQIQGSLSSTAKGNSQITRGYANEAACVNKTGSLTSVPQATARMHRVQN